MDKTNAVESIPEPIDDSHLGYCLALFTLFIGRPNCCAKKHIFAIGRPGRGRGSMFHEGELAGFTAISWDEPNLRFAFTSFPLVTIGFACYFAFTLGDEGKPASIRGPTRTMSIG